MAGDNFYIDILDEGDATLRLALTIAFRSYKAIGYVIVPPSMVLLWTAPDPKPAGFVPLPFKMTADDAALFAERWLSEADYPREPDHDGDNGKGWRVFATCWGHVEGFDYSICAIQPRWQMYGK